MSSSLKDRLDRERWEAHQRVIAYLAQAARVVAEQSPRRHGDLHGRLLNPDEEGPEVRGYATEPKT